MSSAMYLYIYWAVRDAGRPAQIALRLARRAVAYLERFGPPQNPTIIEVAGGEIVLGTSGEWLEANNLRLLLDVEGVRVAI